MVERGELVRVGRGLYMEADAELSEHHDLAVVAASVPKGIVCLLSAAAFHGLGTHVPHQVWIALPPRTWSPTISTPPIRVVHFSGRRYEDEVEESLIEGVHVPVYSLAKTVVDLFRYRNKIGLDVALEALREARRRHRSTLGELTRLAKAGRVLGPMRPYLESIA
jgi:predicted transcriptional regulator of viral defense system